MRIVSILLLSSFKLFANDYYTDLHLAVSEFGESSYSLEKVERLLKKNKETASSSDKIYGRNPLHWAVISTSYYVYPRKMVISLLKVLLSGIDPFKKDRDGENCFHLAAKFDNVEFFELIDKKTISIANEVKGGYVKGNLLEIAIFNRSCKSVSHLLSLFSVKGLRRVLNMPGYGGDAFLHYLIKEDEFKLFLDLKDAPIDFSCVNDDGFTPINLAFSEFRIPFMEVLCKLGLKTNVYPNKPNKDGIVPMSRVYCWGLRFFRTKGGEDLIINLLRCGASALIKSPHNLDKGAVETVLSWAIYSSLPNLALKLIPELQDECLTFQSYSGDTPLHYAYRYRQKKVVEALKNRLKEEDLLITNKRGRYPNSIFSLKLPSLCSF